MHYVARMAYSFACRCALRSTALRHRLSRLNTEFRAFLSSTDTITSCRIITPSCSSGPNRLDVLACSSVVAPIVSDCQSGCRCLHGIFLLFSVPFDDTVTVKSPRSEGTSFGFVLRESCQVEDLRETESSVPWISGYTRPLPPTPMIRLIRGTLASIRERLDTDLVPVSFGNTQMD